MFNIGLQNFIFGICLDSFDEMPMRSLNYQALCNNNVAGGAFNCYCHLNNAILLNGKGLRPM